MDPFTIGIVLFSALVAVIEAFRSGPDDPNWELRQRGLDPEYRNWLAAMATSYKWLASLENPGEAEIAQGFARRERRRQAHFDLGATALLFFGLALALAGLIPYGTVTLALSFFLVVRSVATLLRNRRIRRRLSERSDSEAAPPRPETAPA